MPKSIRHHELEQHFRQLVAEAGLPEPDDTAHLQRALIFLWYDSKAFVLIDLDEIPDGVDPLDGLDMDALRADVLDSLCPPGFIETA
jgi:hypothetical protein